jgi:hypothetical protein
MSTLLTLSDGVTILNLDYVERYECYNDGRVLIRNAQGETITYDGDDAVALNKFIGTNATKTPKTRTWQSPHRAMVYDHSKIDPSLPSTPAPGSDPLKGKQSG